MDRLSQISSKRASVPFRSASTRSFVSGKCLPHAHSAAQRRRQTRSPILAAQGNENGSKEGDQSKQEKLVQGSFPERMPKPPSRIFAKPETSSGSLTMRREALLRIYWIE